MKGPKLAFLGRTIPICSVAAALAFSSQISQAQIITLSDNNSHAQIDPTSQAGMSNWFVDGQNQLQQQWFWYRIGNLGGESSINTISAPAVTLVGLNTAYITY